MNVDWTARGTTVPEPLAGRVERQLQKLERYLHGHSEARVVVTQLGDDVGTALRAIEVVVRNKVGTFTARDESHDLSESANTVMGRIEAQVHRARDKKIRGRRRAEEFVAVEESIGED